MNSCLGSLLLIPAIIGIILTVFYHTSLNSTLRFEQRDSNSQYINTRRSYRPPEQPKQQESEAKPEAKAAGDESAEEVEP